MILTELEMTTQERAAYEILRDVKGISAYHLAIHSVINGGSVGEFKRACSELRNESIANYKEMRRCLGESAMDAIWAM